MEFEIKTTNGAFEADNAINRIRHEVWEHAVNAFMKNHAAAVQNPEKTAEMCESNQDIINRVIERGCVPYHIRDTHEEVYNEMMRRATEPKKIAKKSIDVQMIAAQMVPQNA